MVDVCHSENKCGSRKSAFEKAINESRTVAETKTMLTKKCEYSF